MSIIYGYALPWAHNHVVVNNDMLIQLLTIILVTNPNEFGSMVTKFNQKLSLILSHTHDDHTYHYQI